LWQDLPQEYVIGVDEVGRGCLAGPVYAAAVCLKPSGFIKEINDSKTISPKKRKSLSDKIKLEHHVSVAFSTLQEIEELNGR